MVNGVELAGLVSCSEIKFEKSVIEVPEFSYTRNIQNGITKVPQLDLVYKLTKGSNTLGTLRDWYVNNEVKDVLVIDTDATGVAFQQFICTDCEMTSLSDPEYDAASPGYAKYSVHLVPFNVTPVNPA
jgi:hypothetical protein